MDRLTVKYMTAMVVCAFVGFFPFVRHSRVPVLGLFDFGMHELGHLLFIWAPETLHFLAGSLLQVLVPLGLAAYFWLWRRDLASSAFLVAWTGASAWDVSVYIADAPYERLQLIGGDHDWAFLLHRYDVMRHAELLAGWVKGMGGLLVMAAIALAAAGPWVGDRRPAAGALQPVQGLDLDTGVIDDPWD